MTANKVVISLSGGLDSTCLLLKLLSEGKEVHAYSFKYGQKHEIELTKVKKNIKFLQNKGFKVTHQIIDLTDVFSDSASSLHQGGEAIPHGDYREESMKSTVVENRNVIFGSIIYGKALSWANKTNSNVLITLGLHAGDHCFTGDTKIVTPAGYKTIKDLKPGDLIFSFNPNTLKIEVDKCIDIIEKGTNNEIFNINTTTGSLRVTGEHRVYVKLATDIVIFPAKKLKAGDHIIMCDQLSALKTCQVLKALRTWKQVPITNITISREEEKVYDITVEKNHNFFAGEFGNILISNSIYPDCRPESQQAAEHLFKISNWGSEKVDYIAPFINIDKMHVLEEGVNAMKDLNFTQEEIMEVLKNTHTCYDPDSKGRSCCRCGSCVERIESFSYVGFMDPIEYQDPEYAKKKYEEFYKKYHK